MPVSTPAALQSKFRLAPGSCSLPRSPSRGRGLSNLTPDPTRVRAAAPLTLHLPRTAFALLSDVTRSAQWGRGLLAGCARGCCQRGSELGLERWPGCGACGRRRRHCQRVLSSRGRSRARRCGWTGRGACELRKSTVAEHLTLGALQAGRPVVAPHHRAPRGPGSRAWVSPGSGSSLAGLSNSGQKPQKGDHP